MICTKDERVVGVEREVRAASRGFIDVVSKYDRINSFTEEGNQGPAKPNSHPSAGRIRDSLKVERIIEPCTNDVLYVVVGCAQDGRNSQRKSEGGTNGAGHD